MTFLFLFTADFNLFRMDINTIYGVKLPIVTIIFIGVYTVLIISVLFFHSTSVNNHIFYHYKLSIFANFFFLAFIKWTLIYILNFLMQIIVTVGTFICVILPTVCIILCFQFHSLFKSIICLL